MMDRLCATSLITRTRGLRRPTATLLWITDEEERRGEKKSAVPPRHTLQTLSLPCSCAGGGGRCANGRSRGDARRLEGDCCACEVQTLGAARPCTPRSSTIWRSQAWQCVREDVRAWTRLSLFLSLSPPLSVFLSLSHPMPSLTKQLDR